MRGANNSIGKTDEERLNTADPNGTLHFALLAYKYKHLTLRLFIMKTLHNKQHSKSMLESTIISQETQDNGLENRNTQSPNLRSKSGKQAGVEKAESLMRLTASFLGVLARQENAILEAEQESISTIQKAQWNLARKKEETMEVLRTLW